MNMIKKLVLLVVSLLTTLSLMAATASYSNGKLTLDFIGEWAVVENGNGDISIFDAAGNKLARVTGTPEYDMTITQD